VPLSSDQIILYFELGLILVVYALFIGGLVRARRHRVPKEPTVEQAFQILESALKKAFPDLPEGYTWREIVRRLKPYHLDLDWWEIENTFRKYEDYRYGGIEYKNANAKAIIELAMSLPEGEKYADKTQI
jgi:hypothetical protein